jgi:cytoskeletal protein RodZ
MSPDDSEGIGNGRRFGKATWIIVAGISGLAIAFAAVAVFGSAITPGANESSGPSAETASESATSGPGHNTTSATAPQLTSNASTEADDTASQLPDSELSYGRETSATSDPQQLENATK